MTTGAATSSHHRGKAHISSLRCSSPARTSWRTKMAKSSPTLGIYNSYVASILSISSYLSIVRTRILSFPRARMCANTEVCSALPSAKPSLPRGLLRGGTPERSQKSRQCFLKYFRLDPKFLVSLEKTDARRKQLRYGAGRVVGPPTPPGYGTPLTTLRQRCL